jgi:hypothetical protein
MLKAFVNEIETFEINEDFEWQMLEVGPEKARVIVVDNFYKNPELVRDLALMIPPTTNERILTNLPSGPTSGRINAFYILDHMAPAFDRIYREALPDIHIQMYPGAVYDSFKNATFMVNVMTSENLPPRPPHIDYPDARAYAALVYLNTPDECAGGTGFYTFNGSQQGNSSHVDVEQTRLPDKFMCESEGAWEKVEMVEMKWNRMVMYPQAIYHNAYIKPGMFTGNTYRINQVFFI